MSYIKNVNELVIFLNEIEADIFSTWDEKMYIIKDSSYYQQTKKYGRLIYESVKRALLSDIIDEEEIKLLAYQIANQRINENSNIGKFVYNVNLAKSLLSSKIFNASNEISDIARLQEIINKHSDVFSYHAVTEFAKLKDKQLQEKTLFINETHKERLSILGQLSSSFVHDFEIH
ncbi:MAG: hypothetical protein LRY71_08645 [Bacillaceae bacterium]|nr:hypothetical protein [Bacillaceae bacterium]